MGYHVKEIQRGTYGELSKIKEEVDEALDAEEQNNPIIVLVELADIVGAIEGYLEKNFNGTIKMKDVFVMAKATRRAFESGDRTCRQNTPSTTSESEKP